MWRHLLDQEVHLGGGKPPSFWLNKPFFRSGSWGKGWLTLEWVLSTDSTLPVPILVKLVQSRFEATATAIL